MAATCLIVSCNGSVMLREHTVKRGNPVRDRTTIDLLAVRRLLLDIKRAERPRNMRGFVGGEIIPWMYDAL